jgi:outer membrane protein assembly factor BamB
LYAGFSDGALVAFNAKTGSEQWEITLNRNTKFRDIDASPVIDGDYIYINSYDDKVYCLSKDKGEIIWNANYGGASTPVILGNKIFITSSKGEIVALSKKDGTEIWKNSTKLGVFTEPSVLNDFIVSGESQGKLLFFNAADGVKVGSFEPGRGVFSKPSIYGNNLYFISGEGNLYGLTARHENKSRIYYLK